MSAYDHFAESVRLFAARELEAALASARLAHEVEPDEMLYADAARYLEKVIEEGRPGIYTESDAFSAFISSGSNLPLYDNTRQLLAQRLRDLQPSSLLDIGTGGGTVIVPVAAQLDREVVLTFCEPSLSLLDRAMGFAWERGLDPEAFPYPIEDVLEHTTDTWEVTVATWSLQNLPPSTRATMLHQLVTRTRSLFLAEFDDMSTQYRDRIDPARIRYVHDRYRVGVREYPGKEGRRVRIDFLMPVLYGYFLREGRRSTYEQPIASWEKELRESGFTLKARTLIAHNWWADAYLIEAAGQLDPT